MLNIFRVIKYNILLKKTLNEIFLSRGYSVKELKEIYQVYLFLKRYGKEGFIFTLYDKKEKEDVTKHKAKKLSVA